MTFVFRHAASAAAFLVGSAAILSPALAETAHRHRHLAQVASADERPLTISPRRGGIIRDGNDVYAPGGFSAHGYGYPVATPQERREAENARIRANATGPFGYGVDGLGGTGFEDSPEYGYNNPYYGNAFSSYTGYNGTPTILAFGPGFANRYAAEHDPADDDDDTRGPGPGDLGFSPFN